MKFKLTGIIEAKSAKQALRQVPKGFWVTEASASVEVKSDLEFVTEATSFEFKPSKGVNIEGLARQRDLNKLTNSVLDIVSTGPHASQEDMDKLVKRIEELELIIGAELDETVPYGLLYTTRLGDVRISGSELKYRSGKDEYEYERDVRRT